MPAKGFIRGCGPGAGLRGSTIASGGAGGGRGAALFVTDVRQAGVRQLISQQLTISGASAANRESI